MEPLLQIIDIEIDIRRGEDRTDVPLALFGKGAAFRTLEGAIREIRRNRGSIRPDALLRFRVLFGDVLLAVPTSPGLILDTRDTRIGQKMVEEMFSTAFVDILAGRMSVQESSYKWEAENPDYEECFTQDRGLVKTCSGAGPKIDEFCVRCSKRRPSEG